MLDWQLSVAAYRRNEDRRPRPHWWREYVTDQWRCARLAWELHAESVAIGYTTELAEFRAEVPPPRLGDFMQHLSLRRPS